MYLQISQMLIQSPQPSHHGTTWCIASPCLLPWLRCRQSTTLAPYTDIVSSLLETLHQILPTITPNTAQMAKGQIRSAVKLRCDDHWLPATKSPLARRKGDPPHTKQRWPHQDSWSYCQRQVLCQTCSSSDPTSCPPWRHALITIWSLNVLLTRNSGRLL